MSVTRHILAVGAFAPAERDSLADIARQSAMEIHVESEPAAAAAWLDGHPSVAMLIDGDMHSGEAFAVERRAESQHSTLPVLTWNHNVNDLSFAEAFSWGADDVVSRRDPHALISRLRHMPKTEAPRTLLGIEYFFVVKAWKAAPKSPVTTNSARDAQPVEVLGRAAAAPVPTEDRRLSAKRARAQPQTSLMWASSDVGNVD